MLLVLICVVMLDHNHPHHCIAFVATIGGGVDGDKH